MSYEDKIRAAVEAEQEKSNPGQLDSIADAKRIVLGDKIAARKAATEAAQKMVNDFETRNKELSEFFGSLDISKIADRMAGKMGKAPTAELVLASAFEAGEVMGTDCRWLIDIEGEKETIISAVSKYTKRLSIKPCVCGVYDMEDDFVMRLTTFHYGVSVGLDGPVLSYCHTSVDGYRSAPIYGHVKGSNILDTSVAISKSFESMTDFSDAPLITMTKPIMEFIKIGDENYSAFYKRRIHKGISLGD